jgi:hypothetical protein
MKYVVFETLGGAHPVLFPRGFSHPYLAEVFAPIRVVAAGFVEGSQAGHRCGGESASLSVRSRGGRDAALIHARLTVEGP